MKKIKIGVLKETKNPPDKRVIFTPNQILEFYKQFPNVEIVVQNSKIRSFKDEEYEKLGIVLQENLNDCDILIGIKEVKIPSLIENKTYFFFSHTAKKQEYNKTLLQEILKKNIHLIDHEYLTYKNGERVVAFGYWAGIVGAYNGILAYGKRTGLYQIRRAYECFDKKELEKEVKKAKLPPIKILITGGGRVASGAVKVMNDLNLKKVSSYDFLNKKFEKAVFCQIGPEDYTKSIYDNDFDFQDFIKNPSLYENNFSKYSKVTDVFIPCHFWDPKSPLMLTNEIMREKGFNISIISDVSCDIKKPIASTLRSSSIEIPFYGYNILRDSESIPFDLKNVTVVSIDNLPGELPRNASKDFGKTFFEKVIPALFDGDKDGIIDRASITKNGKLTKKYSYLQNFVDNK